MEVEIEQDAVGYERDIRPLFREKDVSPMSIGFAANQLLSPNSLLTNGFHRQRGTNRSARIAGVC